MSVGVRVRRLLWAAAVAAIGFTGAASLNAGGGDCLPGTSCCGSLSCQIITKGNICTEGGGECDFTENCCVPSVQEKCCTPI